MCVVWGFLVGPIPVVVAAYGRVAFVGIFKVLLVHKLAVAMCVR